MTTPQTQMPRDVARTDPEPTTNSAAPPATRIRQHGARHPRRWVANSIRFPGAPSAQRAERKRIRAADAKKHGRCGSHATPRVYAGSTDRPSLGLYRRQLAGLAVTQDRRRIGDSTLPRKYRHRWAGPRRAPRAVVKCLSREERSAILRCRSARGAVRSGIRRLGSRAAHATGQNGAWFPCLLGVTLNASPVGGDERAGLQSEA